MEQTETKQSVADIAFDYATYKQPADKIRQNLSKIYNDPAASAKRWVWELVQNAKDVPNKFGKVSIEIELVSDDELVFRHNGDPFMISNIIGLIRQVSSKDSLNNDEETTGKFGTGFICTHILSEVIDIKGVLNYEGYRKFDLHLDRSGRSSEELIPRIKEVETKFRKPEKNFPELKDYETNRQEPDFDTSFTYHLATVEKRDSARNGIEDLINTLPITLVTQSKRIKQVRVIDRCHNSDTVYLCDSKEMDSNVKLSTVSINETKKYYLTYETADVALTIEVIPADDGFILIKRDLKQPVLYRDFPLIGSERFYFPYTLNGFRFFPTEKRNSIPLNTNDNLEAKENRLIVNSAVTAAISFNQWLINHNAQNRYLLASSRRPQAEVEYDERVALPWIKDLQSSWRKQLLKQQLVETSDGIFTMSEMLLPDCPKKESRETLWEILRPVAVRKLPKKEHIHEWREIMAEYESWNYPIKYSIEDFLKDLERKSDVSCICEKFNKNENATFAWLNEVIKFTYEELGNDAFEKYAILPNQKGKFRKASELRRDNAEPIPQEIKEVYQIAFDKDINDILLNSSIDVTPVMSIKEYNLSSIIIDTNKFIKDVRNEWRNRRDASYRLTQLYSGDNSRERRKAMFDLCSCFTSAIKTFSKVENVPDDIWIESDVLLLSYIPQRIAECTSLSKVGTEFLEYADMDDDKVIDWLNEYLRLCSDIQCTSQLSSYAIFPNQEGNLKKIEGLSFDNNIPEDIKDLSEIAGTSIKWRSKLLNKRIEGYSLHSPKTVSDIYHSISDAFDKSKSAQQLKIAKYAIALNYNNNPDISYMYSVMNDIYGDMSVSKVLENAEGFDWEKFIACAIESIAGEVASMTNITNLCAALSSESQTYETCECIAWIDRFLTFALNYRGGRYKTKVTELDNHGIWVNQSLDFCMFSALSRDGGIEETIKDLAADNPIVNYNYRDILLHNDSVLSSAIDRSKVISQDDVLSKIDESLEAYELNKQNPEFRSLIFRIMELDKSLHISDHMKYYKSNKEKLIVGSLGEGETMNMVASIIQQGDEKIRVVKDILEGNSIEDLNNIKAILQGCPADKLAKVKDFIDNMNNGNEDPETPLTGEDKTDINVVTVPETYAIEAENFEGYIQIVNTDQAQYAGLSLEEIEKYVDEAKGAVVKYFRELNDKNPNLGLQFDNERIKKHSYSQLYGIKDKTGKDIPIVVHSYKGPQYRFFDLNWYDWQLLSQEGSMLFVLTVTGLQCIPLYALPVRKFEFSLSDELSNENRAALLTLAAIGNKYSNLSFDFGNNMPQNFTDPLPFNYVPEQLDECIKSIKEVCDKNIPRIANMYNNGKNIKLKASTNGYSSALKEMESGNARDIFDAPANDLQAPSVGTSFID